MTTGNGSDEASLDFTMKYNPPVGAAAAELRLKDVKEILDGLESCSCCRRGRAWAR
jgi:hypothetical protein